MATTEYPNSDQSGLEDVGPHTRCVDELERQAAVIGEVRRYGERIGAGEAAIVWGCKGAQNAVIAGDSGHRAIRLGEQRIDDMVSIKERTHG